MVDRGSKIVRRTPPVAGHHASGYLFVWWVLCSCTDGGPLTAAENPAPERISARTIGPWTTRRWPVHPLADERPVDHKTTVGMPARGRAGAGAAGARIGVSAAVLGRLRLPGQTAAAVVMGRAIIAGSSWIRVMPRGARRSRRPSSDVRSQSCRGPLAARNCARVVNAIPTLPPSGSRPVSSVAMSPIDLTGTNQSTLCRLITPRN